MNPHNTLAASGSDAIARLMSEHRLIERALDALDRWASDLTIGPPSAASFQEIHTFLPFFRDFVDGLHHHKEEQVLFTAMADTGFPRHAGPIAVMEHDHQLGRAHIAALSDLTSRPLDAGAIASVTAHAHEFSSRLRAHIRKEDQILYPMAVQVLGDAMKSVHERCAAHDLDHTADIERHLGAIAPLL